jgi:hypothetical protein
MYSYFGLVKIFILFQAAYCNGILSIWFISYLLQFKFCIELVAPRALYVFICFILNSLHFSLCFKSLTSREFYLLYSYFICTSSVLHIRFTLTIKFEARYAILSVYEYLLFPRIYLYMSANSYSLRSYLRVRKGASPSYYQLAKLLFHNTCISPS